MAKLFCIHIVINYGTLNNKIINVSISFKKESQIQISVKYYHNILQII